MDTVQTGILENNPPLARYMTYTLHTAEAITNCLRELKEISDGDNLVIGLGQSLLQALGKQVEGLRVFPVLTTPGLDIPSTPAALWCWLRGNDRGELFHQSRLIEGLLADAFTLADCTDAFSFDEVRDLSGYEDGTENPEGDDAIDAAIVQDQGPGMDGSSFVAIQQWLHDFDTFDAMSPEQQDDTFGRHVADNEEFDEAPESAHVKRTAQESFEPEAFMLRHSMPWAEDTHGGLMFVAFGKSFDAFEAVLNRMVGHEDGVQDALFTFTRPMTGCYFWCPPMKGDTIDLSLLGI
jgi:putative iron-dependent peroxidase